MKSLAFIMDSLCYGGAEIQTIGLVNQLAEMNYRIILFSMNSKDVLKDRINKSVEVHVLNKKCYMDLGCLIKIIRILRKFKPDTMLFVNTYSMLYGYLTSFFLSGKVRKIVIQHSNLLQSTFEKTKNVVYKRIMNRMDYIVFVCDKQKQHWVSQYHIYPKKSVVIYNGIDVCRFENHKIDKTAVLNRTGFLASHIIIGINARMTEEKRHEDLIEAFDMLIQEHYPVRLLIIGDGHRRSYIEEIIRSRGLEDKVYITGFVDDVRDFLACVDISVLASSTEALSMAVIESMAMSKPIVITDVGGARELVQPFENGITYIPGNVKGLFTSLAYIIDNKLIDSMGQKSLARVKKMFLKTSMVENYIKLL